MMRRALAWILCAVMLVTSVPVSAEGFNPENDGANPGWEDVATSGTDNPLGGDEGGSSDDANGEDEGSGDVPGDDNEEDVTQGGDSGETPGSEEDDGQDAVPGDDSGDGEDNSQDGTPGDGEGNSQDGIPGDDSGDGEDDAQDGIPGDDSGDGEDDAQDGELTDGSADGEDDQTQETEDPAEEPVIEAQPLEIALTAGRRFAFAGETVELTLNASGGAGELKVTYEVSREGQLVNAQSDAKTVDDGVDVFVFAPETYGDYAILAEVTDEAGQLARQSVTLPVAEHDTTSLAEWTTLAESVKRTGDWRQDVAAVANTQLGYTQSETDFIILEDGSRHHYSIYGDWYSEDEYASYNDEWNAEFVSFVLSYAGVPSGAVPQTATAQTMRTGVMNAFHTDSTYTPEAGDLVFLEGRVGIVCAADENALQVIEGVEGAVTKQRYDIGAAAITGYASMREIMPVVFNETDYEAYIERTEQGQLPEGAVFQNGKVYYLKLQDAVDNVNANETIQLMKDVNGPIKTNGQSFELNLYYPPSGKADPRMVISGNGDRVFEINGGNVTLSTGILRGGDVVGDGGALHVSGNAEVTLDGMSLDGNHATGNGGGIYAENATVTFNNNTTRSSYVSNNRADGSGGGIYANNATVTWNEVAPKTDTLTANTAGSNGGAIALVNNASLTLNDYCYIYTNKAGGNGGGIYAENSGVKMTSSSYISIFDNTAVNGGGIALSGSSAKGTINGYFVAGRFKGTTDPNPNSASQNGGAIYVNGGKLELNPDAQAKNTATIVNNTAVNGGGIALVNGAEGDITGSIVGSEGSANTASGYGGGVYVQNATLTDTNKAYTYVWYNKANKDGGGIYADASTVTTSYMRIRFNQADGNGGGAAFSGITAATLKSADFLGNKAVGNGGGIYANGTGNLTVSANSTLSGNEAVNGGGIALVDSTCEFKLQNISVTGNTATGDGGGLYASNVTNLTVNIASGVTLFKENQAKNGGGMAFTDNTKATLTSNTIQENTATVSGGGLYVNNAASVLVGRFASTPAVFEKNTAANGGGAAVVNCTNSVTFRSVEFKGNSATDDGGALYANGATNLTIDTNTAGNCVISGNQAKNGGGIALKNGSAGLLKNIVQLGSPDNGNVATASGGALYVHQSSIDLRNSSVNYNQASNGAALFVIGAPDDQTVSGNRKRAVYIEGCNIKENTASGTSSDTGVIYLSSSSANASVYFNTCTIENDSAVNGAPIYAHLTASDSDSDPALTIYNSSISNNRNNKFAGGMYISDGNVLLYNTKIANNEASGGVFAAGGVLYTGGSQLWLYGATITGNSGSDGNIGTAGGVFIYHSGSFKMDYSAVYGNTADAGDANDFWIKDELLFTYIPAPGNMSDSLVANKTFTDYVWRNVDPKTGEITFYNTSVNYSHPNNSFDMYYHGARLTSIPYSTAGGVAQKGEKLFDSVAAAVADARNKGEDSALITIVAKDMDDVLNGETVTIDLPVEVQLNDHGLHAGIGCDDSKLFSVTGKGSLALTGPGVINGKIAIENDSVLRLSGKLNALHVLLGSNALSCQEGAGNAASIRFEDDFYCSGTLYIELDKNTANRLNKPNPEENIYVTLVENFGSSIALSDVHIGGVNYPDTVNSEMRLVVDANGNLVAVNPHLNGIYLSSSQGNDVNDGAIRLQPVKTMAQALKLLEGSDLDTVFVLDEAGYTISGSESWTSGKPVVIRRHASGKQVSGKPLITVPGNATLTLSSGITIDGYSSESYGSTGYTNCGTLILVETNGTLVLSSGATLCNNDVSSTGSGLRDRSGGAVYCAGTMSMTGGAIENCAALLGAGVFVTGNGASFSMSGGIISGNEATGTLGSGKESVYASGGGICAYEEAQIRFSGGEISGNTAMTGGGIALGSGHYTYSGKSSLALVMSGGTISGNTSKQEGGGLFVQGTYQARITKGKITGNRSDTGYVTPFGGGGIYVNSGDPQNGIEDGKLIIPSTVSIHDNNTSTTGSSGGGAGIAGCGTSTVIVRMDGSKIYNNRCDGVPDDLLIATSDGVSSNTGSGTPNSSLPQFMFDGTPYCWLKGPAGGESEEVTTEYLAGEGYKRLYTLATPQTPDADVIIAGNTSQKRGAGIGTNGQVNVGNSSTMLTVKKTVAGSFIDRNREFTFTVTLKDTSIHGKYGDMTFDSGVAKVTLKDGESKTATGLPAGTGYTVTETDNEGYNVTWSGNTNTGTITSDDTIVVECTNTRKTGNLKVEKTVTGTAGDKQKAFTFTVTLEDKTITGTFGDMTFNKGIATFTLRHGESATAKGLPAGIKYTVTETNNEGYTVTVTGKTTGTIPDGGTHTVTFVNSKDSTPTPEETQTPAPEATPTPTPVATPTPTPMEFTSVAGQKSWDDDDDANGIRPDSVVVRLLQNGNVIAQQTVTADSGWRYSFDDLPVWDDSGNRYEYAVSEQMVRGYYSQVDGYDLTNKLLPGGPNVPDDPVEPPHGFETLRPTEENLEALIRLFGYDTPLFGGLLKTGDEIPAYPFIFAGVGLASVVALLSARRKKKRKQNG